MAAYRYADPHREDDAWAYIPNLRRVRRISAEVKWDSLLGTEHTLEDFYSFSGRELEWHWRFLGWKNQLAVQDSAHDYTYLYGPNGFIPNDTWTMRRFAVVEPHAHLSTASLQERCRRLGFAELRCVDDGSVRPQEQAMQGLGIPEEVERNLRQEQLAVSYQ